MRILVVDDEQDLCEIVQYNLQQEGYEVDTANSAEEALALRLCDYDLLLLDVMMGEMSGFRLAQHLKERPETAHVPIIFVTALDGEEDTIRGLNLGADDYMAKPLSMRELKARVRTVLRRTSTAVPRRPAILPAQDVVYGTLSLHLDTKRATLEGEALSLTKLEFELLALFLQHPGRLFSREELLKRCWPSDTIVTDRTVDVNLARIRKKIGEYGRNIKARMGYGYIFEQ